MSIGVGVHWQRANTEQKDLGSNPITENEGSKLYYLFLFDFQYTFSLKFTYNLSNATQTYSSSLNT